MSGAVVAGAGVAEGSCARALCSTAKSDATTTTNMQTLYFGAMRIDHSSEDQACGTRLSCGYTHRIGYPPVHSL
jgi:hypothetical protein